MTYNPKNISEDNTKRSIINNYLDLYELKKYSVEDKEIAVNENFAKISAYLRGGILSKQLNNPALVVNKTSCAKYIIPADAQGEWTGKIPGTIAMFFGGDWLYIKPQEGNIFWVSDEAALYAYHREQWRKLAGI